MKRFNTVANIVRRKIGKDKLWEECDDEFLRAKEDNKRLRNDVKALTDSADVVTCSGNEFLASMRRFQDQVMAFSQQPGVSQILPPGFLEYFGGVQEALGNLVDGLVNAIAVDFRDTFQTQLDNEFRAVSQGKSMMYRQLIELNSISDSIKAASSSNSVSSQKKLLEAQQQKQHSDNNLSLMQEHLWGQMRLCTAHATFKFTQSLIRLLRSADQHVGSAHQLLSQASQVAAEAERVLSSEESRMSEESRTRAAQRDAKGSAHRGSLTPAMFAQICSGLQVVTGRATPEQLGITLYPGEAEAQQLSGTVHVTLDRESSPGTLLITNYRILFAPFVSGDGDDHGRVISVPLLNIANVEELPGSKFATLCKDLRSFVFSLRHCEQAGGDAVSRVLAVIRAVLASPNNQDLFAFSFRLAPPAGFNGWDVYDPHREYERLGIPSRQWRFSTANQDYRLCRTYPSVLVVPAGVTDDVLNNAGNFRSKARIPALCWRRGGDRIDADVAIVRCSQPLVGVRHARSHADEGLLAAAASTSTTSSPSVEIYDARPALNSAGNSVMGGGSEVSENYVGAHHQFLGIDNIHAVRQSFVTLHGLFAANPSNTVGITEQRTRMEAKLRASGATCAWFRHLSSILVGTQKIVATIQSGTTCVIHCSDGWDRTAQLTSLSQLLLDPFYRTLAGFEVLVEKEWLSFGHKFATRCGHSEERTRADFLDKQRSPIFIQWLDCVHQVLSQNPTAFEFNDKLLATLPELMYSCRFGTFLGDNEAERTFNSLRTRSVSVWTEINTNADMYTNPRYRPVEMMPRLRTSAQDLCLWELYAVWWASVDPDTVGMTPADMTGAVEDDTDDQPRLKTAGSSPTLLAGAAGGGARFGAGGRGPPPRPQPPAASGGGSPVGSPGRSPPPRPQKPATLSRGGSAMQLGRTEGPPLVAAGGAAAAGGGAAGGWQRPNNPRPPPARPNPPPGVQSGIAAAMQARFQQQQQQQPRGPPQVEAASSSVDANAAHSRALPTPPQRQPTERRLRAKFRWEATESNEIGFEVGEILFLDTEHTSGWWEGHKENGERGIFPANYVEDA